MGICRNWAKIIVLTTDKKKSGASPSHDINILLLLPKHWWKQTVEYHFGIISVINEFFSPIYFQENDEFPWFHLHICVIFYRKCARLKPLDLIMYKVSLLPTCINQENLLLKIEKCYSMSFQYSLMGVLELGRILRRGPVWS